MQQLQPLLPEVLSIPPPSVLPRLFCVLYSDEYHFDLFAPIVVYTVRVNISIFLFRTFCSLISLFLVTDVSVELCSLPVWYSSILNMLVLFYYWCPFFIQRVDSVYPFSIYSFLALSKYSPMLYEPSFVVEVPLRVNRLEEYFQIAIANLVQFPAWIPIFPEFVTRICLHFLIARSDLSSSMVCFALPDR